MGFTAATYNVNSIRARLPLLTAWLDRVHPDIVCLQETKVPDASFPHDVLTALGYHAVYRGEKSYNGVAVLSVAEPTEIRAGFDDGGPPDEARLLAVTLGGIHVVNTYIPQGRDADDPKFAYKLAWLDRLRGYFDRRFTPTDPVLWLGDFNVAPTPIDVHDPKRLADHVCFHPRARAALERVRAWGFVDVFRRHVDAPNQYTFYDYRAKNPLATGKGWRVDHIWATEPLAAQSTASWIDLDPRKAARPSDHTPLLARFAS